MPVEFWIVSALILIGGPLFTLAWWKIADRWADDEHRRFRKREPDENVTRIVVKEKDRP